MSQELFSFIKSMSKSEKRYFRRYCGLHGSEGGRYMALFDALEGADGYVVGDLKAEMGWKNFERNFAVTGRYLFDKLLDSLHAYGKAQPGLRTLEQTLHRIRMLAERRQLKTARKRIRAALKVVGRTEDFGIWLELLQIERDAYVRNAKETGEHAHLRALNAEIQRVSDAQGLMVKVRGLHYVFFSVLGTHKSVPDEKFWPELETAFAQLQDLQPQMRPWFMSQVFYLQVLNQYRFLKGDIDGSRAALDEIVALFESRPEMIARHRRKFMASLHNSANRNLAVRNFGTALQRLQRFRYLRTDTPRDEGFRLESFYLSGLALIVNSGYIDENENILHETITCLEKKAQLLSHRFRLNICLMLAIALFMSERYREALKWIQTVLNDPETAGIRLFFRMTNIFHLLVHLELGNHDWLEYALRKLREELRDQESYRFETAFFTLLRGLLGTGNKRDRNDCLEAFLATTSELESDATEAPVFSFFHFQSWAIAKREGRKLRDLIREDWLAEGHAPLLFGK